MVGVGDSWMDGGTKKSGKQYKILESNLPIVPVKVEFLSTELFWRFNRSNKTNKPG